MPALYPAFFFVLEKAGKSAGNAVISTLLMHRSYGLQHLRHKRLTFASADKSGYTHSAFGERSHTAAHTVKQGCFGWGWYHYSRSVPHVHQHPRAGYQNGKFCRFWGLVGGAPKKRREPSGQRCAHACRCPEGVAAPLGCVIFFDSVEIATCMPCTQGFPHVWGRGGITTLSALYVLSKRWTAAC